MGEGSEPRAPLTKGDARPSVSRTKERRVPPPHLPFPLTKKNAEGLRHDNLC